MATVDKTISKIDYQGQISHSDSSKHECMLSSSSCRRVTNQPIHDPPTAVDEVENRFSVSHSLGLRETLHAVLGELKAVFNLFDGVAMYGVNVFYSYGMVCDAECRSSGVCKRLCGCASVCVSSND